MELDTVLTTGRGLLHLAAFIIIASHSGAGLRWKPHVSLLAIVLAGSSAGLASITLLGLSNQIPLPQWAVNVYAIGVFAASVSCRGNLARLVPMKLRSNA